MKIRTCVVSYTTAGNELKGDLLLLDEVGGKSRRGRVLIGSGHATLQLKFSRSQKAGIQYEITLKQFSP